jgi:adenylate cyclase
VERALELAEAAIDRDPKFAPALMLAGFARSQLLYSGWADDPQACRRLGLAHCRRALKLAPDDPMVLSLASSALPSLGVNFTEARRLADRALEINPGSAGNMLGSGWTNAIDGDAELALSRFAEALRLDPRSPLRFFNLTGQGIALFALQRFDAAAAILLGVAQAMPDYPPAQVFLGASLAHLGRLDEARAAFERAGAGLDASLSILREPARRALLLSAIALAEPQAG